MSNTRVVHVNDNVPGAVYIGRAVPRRDLKASIFANPYKIGTPSTHPLIADPIGREGALPAVIVLGIVALLTVAIIRSMTP